MATYGYTYRCQHCGVEEVYGEDNDLEEQYDRYGIYAGMWHEKCWKTHGYEDFVFDPAYAGESLEEDA